MITSEFILEDYERAFIHDVKTKVRITDKSVEIDFHGFGVGAMEPGHGYPVYIEVRNGIPHVLVWADINNEEPTHVISLENAAEVCRKDIDGL